MNKAESERLASLLDVSGYQHSGKIEEADLIFLNTCVVRQSAENRIINKLHSLKALKKNRPRLKIALTGCFVSPDTIKLRSTFPFVDYFFPAGELPEWLSQFSRDQALPRQPDVSTYVPIMQGCDNFCSYCIVPYRRGRERSHPLDEIICEVRGLIQRGVKEVILLGQNVDSYGHDLPDKPDLADLLYRLNAQEGLLRIRFLTNHPKDMKSKLIEAISSLDKVCKQINLPVQSGDNDILTAMRRGYTIQRYRELIDELKAKIPGISLSTDVIVGFPGESEAQFQNTYNLLEEIKFDMVHVAAYSPRPETLAARTLKDDVTTKVKKFRLEQIEKLQADIVSKINAGLQGQSLEVLVERKEKGKWMGRTCSDKVVFFSRDEDYQSKLVNVRILRTTAWSLTGEVQLSDVNI
jgi:tRNA-2-methylthio-N6-dimethylallyladenosine synthase